MGDFNVHWNAGSKSTVKCFQQSLAATNFKQYIESATHKSGNTTIRSVRKQGLH